jgi:uncharacterized membrane protein YphA (DoxX/SURF4 family)
MVLFLVVLAVHIILLVGLLALLASRAPRTAKFAAFLTFSVYAILAASFAHYFWASPGMLSPTLTPGYEDSINRIDNVLASIR